MMIETLVSFGNAVAPEVKASHNIFMFGYVSNPFLFWWDPSILVAKPVV